MFARPMRPLDLQKPEGQEGKCTWIPGEAPSSLAEFRTSEQCRRVSVVSLLDDPTFLSRAVAPVKFLHRMTMSSGDESWSRNLCSGARSLVFGYE